MVLFLRKHIVILSTLASLLYLSCMDEPLEETGKLTFSTDTVMFDTIFTQIGSFTRQFRIYNPHNHDIVVSSISLAKGSSSAFRLNIDGEPANNVRNIRIRGKDSLYIFVEVTIDPESQQSPMIVEDSIVFITNGHRQDVKLVAWGQDVHLYIARTLKTQTWTANKPYLIYFNVLVDSLHTLTIEKGTQVHFHRNASMVVKGNLKVNGTLDEPVVFQGDRLDELFSGFSYDEVPGQWGTIAFLDGSKGNVMNYAIIKNATAGMQLGDYDKSSPPDITLNNTIIQNNSFAGIYSFGSTIRAHNTIIANSGYYNIFVGKGGSLELFHCTIANYWSTFSNRSTPSVYLSNYFTYVDPDTEEKQVFSQDLEKAYFGNSIIYGSMKTELALADTSGKAFNYAFDHCLIKLPEDYDYPGEDKFVNVITQSDSLFMDTEKLNFELDTLSAAQNHGLMSIGKRYPTDYNGNSRVSDEGPDLGAYERIE